MIMETYNTLLPAEREAIDSTLDTLFAEMRWQGICPSCSDASERAAEALAKFIKESKA
jgi:hypothetical protein